MSQDTPSSPPRVPRDFYADLMRASQTSRAGFLAERERWLRGVPVEGREELLFEFEMLLRAVERYLNLNTVVDARDRPLVTRDFREELADVRDAMDRAIRVARHLQDPDSDQKMVFRKYVETQLADDRVRRALIEEQLDQETPPESLFVLREAFDALKNLLDHLLKLPAANLGLFQDVGKLSLREIVLNRYFRPFRPLEFRVEYDRLRSVRLLDTLVTLQEEQRTAFTTAFLGLFRLLHYLAYVDAEEQPPFSRRVRVLLALVRSEATALASWMHSELSPKAGSKSLQAATLRAARDIARETERVAREVLVNLDRDAEAPLRAASAFTAVLRTQVVALVEALAPNGGLADGVFDELMSPQEAALRLRKDLWVYAQLCRAAESHLRAEDVPAAERVLDALKGFLGYFHDGSYQLLRYGDYDAFDRFTSLLVELPWPPEGPGIRARLGEDLRRFIQTLESTFHAVSRRTHLQGRGFDRQDAEALRDRFLTTPAR
ncbi:hypothetical protein [Myxococcus xanthus]|uniref:Uncharacterized protein n=1 Tax=Myxococcus xanthus TaxID=34 RepID=A0AAE6G340_MYXXA|nr:hypothetical protein [Myxococcus xanthus]QDE69962.1 hypothetical protein BHS09_24935 [Myxococcus xanthus]QDE77241.1 hypothetical protein BHS08_24960 [Myxococcus xanthus]QDE84623.1 hypothetical protein BHS07_25425 [Myxococcus xanthus]QDE98787.1 hypothetical protein BHS05_24760 [Myxococcus xanthus]QDF06442.1 hypothetical protein BHS04_25065 [Myxococcus xanthus]